MAALNNNFTWKEGEAKQEQPCYSIDPKTGERTLINAHTMDQSQQLEETRRRLVSTGSYTNQEIHDIIERMKR